MGHLEGVRCPLGKHKTCLYETWAKSSLNLFDLCCLGVLSSLFFKFQVLVALELEWGLGLNEQQARILRCLSRDYVCIELGDIMNLRTQEGRKGPWRTKSSASFTKKGREAQT